jgi:hypothetical protein
MWIEGAGAEFLKGERQVVMVLRQYLEQTPIIVSDTESGQLVATHSNSFQKVLNRVARHHAKSRRVPHSLG